MSAKGMSRNQFNSVRIIENVQDVHFHGSYVKKNKYKSKSKSIKLTSENSLIIFTASCEAGRTLFLSKPRIGC